MRTRRTRRTLPSRFSNHSGLRPRNFMVPVDYRLRVRCSRARFNLFNLKWWAHHILQPPRPHLSLSLTRHAHRRSAAAVLPLATATPLTLAHRITTPMRSRCLLLPRRATAPAFRALALPALPPCPSRHAAMCHCRQTLAPWVHVLPPPLRRSSYELRRTSLTTSTLL